MPKGDSLTIHVYINERSVGFYSNPGSAYDIAWYSIGRKWDYEEAVERALGDKGIRVETRDSDVDINDDHIINMEFRIAFQDLTSISFIKEAMEERGAPKGSRIVTFREDSVQEEMSFGVCDGLALSQSVEADEPESLSFTIWEEITKILAGVGEVRAMSCQPCERSLYLYGRSADEIRSRLEPYMNSQSQGKDFRLEQLTPM